MGSSSSKVSRAAGSAARQYPTRQPSTLQPSNSSVSRPIPSTNSGGPKNASPLQASASRSEAIDLDASDPDFARSLRSIGPVQPNPTLSQTSAFPSSGNRNAVSRTPRPDPKQNPALAVLEARSRLQDEADQEFIESGRKGHPGKQFLDVFTIRQMLVLRDERGQTAQEIERALGLRNGTVERLGGAGVVGLVQEVGRAQKGVEMV